ncbi:MAG: ribosomal protein S18-alanine N-acetyltransferase [Desulfurococcales archaeon]|jgi:ribosomal-protein-alanine N-acetyltransferase|nr:ribosomal protein S18-alanine N-acetyltransferase [Desulfurococcales archaeon]
MEDKDLAKNPLDIECFTNPSENMLAEIYGVELTCFKDPYPPRLLLYYLRLSQDLFIVCRSEDKVVGYAIGIIENFGKTGHVVSICVHRNYRGRGIGRRLMEILEKLFREKGAIETRLEVRVSNEIAIRLYRSMGYTIAGVYTRYYSNGEDAYIMVKKLSPDD